MWGGVARYLLTPAYDLVNVAIANPKDREELALTLNGRKSKLQRSDFIKAGAVMGLEENVVVHLMDSMHRALPKWQELIKVSFLSDDMKDAYERLVASRLERL